MNRVTLAVISGICLMGGVQAFAAGTSGVQTGAPTGCWKEVGGSNVADGKFEISIANTVTSAQLFSVFTAIQNSGVLYGDNFPIVDPSDFGNKQQMHLIVEANGDGSSTPLSRQDLINQADAAAESLTKISGVTIDCDWLGHPDPGGTVSN